MRSVGTAAVPQSKEAWLEKFFRFGFVCKGVVYCLLGVLTVFAAIGIRSDKATKKDTFEFIYAQPLGKFLLALIAIGLFGYVTFKFFQTFKDNNFEGNETKGIIKRIGYGINALLYLSLGLYASKLVLDATAGDGHVQKFIVGKVLAWEAGDWIIGIAALITMISGVTQIYKGASVKFMRKMQQMSSSFRDVFKKAGIVGYVSRGIVLLIIGYFLLHAALNKNPGEVQDTDGAFSFLENNFGSVIMGIVALGLVAYGIFMFVRAKYERMIVRV